MPSGKKHYNTSIILTMLFFSKKKLGFSHFTKQFFFRVGCPRQRKKSLPSGNNNSSKQNSSSSLVMVLEKAIDQFFLCKFHFFHLKTISTRVSTTLPHHNSIHTYTPRSMKVFAMFVCYLGREKFRRNSKKMPSS